MSLSARLSFGDSTFEVGPGGRQVMSLSKDDAIEHGIKASIAAAVKPMTCTPRGGGLQRRDARVGSHLRIGHEAGAGTEDACESAGCEQADTTYSG